MAQHVDPYTTPMFIALDPPPRAQERAIDLASDVGVKVRSWPASQNTFGAHGYGDMISADPLAMTRRVADELFTTIPTKLQGGAAPRVDQAAIKRTLALFNDLMWWLDPSTDESSDWTLAHPAAPAVLPWHNFLSVDDPWLKRGSD